MNRNHGFRPTTSSRIFAAACTVAIAYGAHAQTSPITATSPITVYGVADVGVVLEGGGTAGAKTKITSGVAAGTRLGVKGSKNLGQGMSGFFTIEAGFGFDTGTPAQGVTQANQSQGVLFGRQALLGLGTPTLGTVSMGRQYTPVATAVAGVADPFAVGMAGSAVNIFASTGLRANNTVLYASPSYSGFRFDAMASFGELSTGSDSLGRGVGGTLIYENGPLKTRLAHWRRNASVTGVDPARNSIFAARYDFGPARVHFGYAINSGPGSAFYLGQTYVAPAIHNPYGSVTPPTASINSRDILIGMGRTQGNHTILASYIARKDRTAFAQHASQVALGYSYALQGGADIYTSVGRIWNKNGAGYTVGNGGDVTFGSGNRAINFGVRYVF